MTERQKKQVEFVCATMAFEDMELTKDEIKTIENIATGKESAEDVINRLLEKYRGLNL